MKAWVGIDPGLTGAIAFISDDGEAFRVERTPILTVKIGKKDRVEYNVPWMVSILQPFQEDSHIHVTIERVGAMPGQGVVSMFRFGYGAGLWEGILASLKIPYTFVHPATWKRVMMAGMGKDKGASVVRAQQLFPKHLATARVSHGEADAILIAEWGRRDHWTVEIPRTPFR